MAILFKLSMTILHDQGEIIVFNTALCILGPLGMRCCC